MVYLLFTFTFIVVFVYAYFIIRLRYLPHAKALVEEFNSGVSIIIPFRNEEKALPSLLESLVNQKYNGNFELILVNDHSSDKSVEIINQWIDKYSSMDMSMLSLDNNEGKKAALFLGVSSARYPYILQADADCTMGENWICQSMKPFVNNTVKASLGMVKMVHHNNMMTQLFSLEFLSLQASGAALAQKGMPIMANGANLAYERDVWLKFHPKEEKWISGDDVFFIQQLALINAESIVHNHHSIVETDAPDSLKTFMKQRIRWGSKTEAYPMKSAQNIAYGVALTNVLLFVAVLMVFLFPQYFYVLVLLYVIKAIPDYLLVRKYALLCEQRSLLKMYPIAALLYPVYIVISGFLIVFFSHTVQWKSRSIKKDLKV